MNLENGLVRDSTKRRSHSSIAAVGFALTAYPIAVERKYMSRELQRLDQDLQVEEALRHEFVYAGPLFIHHLSHMWIDFRGIQDDYMRRKTIDYFENSRRAIYVQQTYAMRNPKKFIGYGRFSWGITASDGPGPAERRVNGRRVHFFDYKARSIPYGPDDGTLAPWAVAASCPSHRKSCCRRCIV